MSIIFTTLLIILFIILELIYNSNEFFLGIDNLNYNDVQSGSKGEIGEPGESLLCLDFDITNEILKKIIVHYLINNNLEENKELLKNIYDKHKSNFELIELNTDKIIIKEDIDNKIVYIYPTKDELDETDENVIIIKDGIDTITFNYNEYNNYHGTETIPFYSLVKDFRNKNINMIPDLP